MAFLVFSWLGVILFGEAEAGALPNDPSPASTTGHAARKPGNLLVDLSILWATMDLDRAQKKA